MPDDLRGRRRAGTGLGLLPALVPGAVLLTALPDDGGREGGAACGPRQVGSWSAERALTAEFARYGDDPARTDDWTGGDGTHSVRLPDGRLPWLLSDTCPGRVHPPPNPFGESAAWREGAAPLVRNSGVVMRDGRLELPDLRVEAAVRIAGQQGVPDPSRRVLYGTGRRRSRRAAGRTSSGATTAGPPPARPPGRFSHGCRAAASASRTPGGTGTARGGRAGRAVPAGARGRAATSTGWSRPTRRPSSAVTCPGTDRGS